MGGINLRSHNMEIKIQSNIPFPTKKSFSRGLTATLRKMKIGDSFEIPMTSRAALYPAVRRIGIKIISQKSDETNIRVWRIR